MQQCANLDPDTSIVRDSLADRAELFESLFNDSGLAKVLYDQETLAILEANPAASVLYGYTREELKRRTMLDIRPRDDGASFVETIRRQGNAGAVHHSASRHIASDGHIIDVEVTSNRISFAGRRARLAEIVDVTARRRAEEALKDREQRLSQAMKMEAVGRMAAGIAHDFNNVLTAIGGYCELIRQRWPSGTISPLATSGDATPLDADIGEIMAATDRAAALIRQLMAFSRGTMMEIGDVSLVEIVHDISRMLERIIGRGIDMVVDVPEGIPRVLANATQLQQVILNLAMNARDAMPGGGTLTLTLRNATYDDGEWVELSVADTGIGIPADIQSRVFEPFFTTKPSSHGTGLGLATVYGIVNQFGGSISFESNVGRGTTFNIRLAARDSVAPIASHHGCDV